MHTYVHSHTKASSCGTHWRIFISILSRFSHTQKKNGKKLRLRKIASLFDHLSKLPYHSTAHSRKKYKSSDIDGDFFCRNWWILSARKSLTKFVTEFLPIYIHFQFKIFSPISINEISIEKQFRKNPNR